MAETQHRVTVLELFFDLVFVFAITQVTGTYASDLTLAGLGRGTMILAALWWAWVAYSWLTNTLYAEDAAPRVTVLAAMGAMLLVALAVPAAFGEHALLFSLSYALVRALHVILYYLAARKDPEFRRGVLRLGAPLMIGAAILVAASLAEGRARTLLWAVALVVDYSGPLIAGPRGWRVHAAHFSERHGLIVLIALGEAIVSIGVGATGLTLAGPVLAGAILAVVIAGALWWAYFDVVALEAEHRLQHVSGEAQVLMARDAFSYLHLPMVVGIVLFALGVKKSIAHADHALELVPSIALYGGLALYFFGHIVFRKRLHGAASPARVTVTLILGAGVPLGMRVPALVSLGLCAAVATSLVAFETFAQRERRRQVRHG